MEIPASYEFINQYNGTRSPTGSVEFDKSTSYFFRCLYERLLSVFDFTIPEEWNKNYFLNVLLGCGYVGIVPTAAYGVIPQLCTFSGYGLYLQPTELIVAQPLVQYRGRIGEECCLFRLTPDYRGVCDIVEHYAVQLSTIFTSIKMSLYNSRLSYLAIAKNKAAAETLKLLLEKISSGEPAVIFDKLLKEDDLSGTDSIFTEAFHAKDSYITDALLRDFQTIINSFDREIGIPIIDEKKERRIESEVNSLTSDTATRIQIWKVMLDESIKQVEKVFPDIRISYEERYKNVTDTTVNPDRDVQL